MSHHGLAVRTGNQGDTAIVLPKHYVDQIIWERHVQFWCIAVVLTFVSAHLLLYSAGNSLAHNSTLDDVASGVTTASCMTSRQDGRHRSS